MSSKLNSNHSFRKWFGAMLILLEVFTSSANIYGFSAFFSILAQQGVYQNYCNPKEEADSMSAPSMDCVGQTKHYEV